MITVRAVGVDDWATWRELRLAALADAPDAFGATLREWQDADEQRWRDRLAVGRNLVAEFDDKPAGMVSGFDNPDGTLELGTLWVTPDARGRGVGEALIDGLVDWAGERTVRLEVVTSNTHARDLYRRNGFVDEQQVGDRLTMVHAGPTARFLAELNADIWQPYRDAYAAGDTEAFLALHTPELIRAGGPGKTVQGFDEYAAASRTWRAEMDERGSRVAIEFRFTERITDGELASERGVYRLTATRADGDQKVFHGHFHTFARKIYGHWRIAVDYDNTDASPADFDAATDPDDFTAYLTR
ncbi:GNAT family N-acetyltransferase [Kutzneria kofuensis]|uniref:Ribosomal protein S18 acetylase RimI-like enzyme/ketosteroid isomerase-like protein n=1 Tax=Kutzneria kofuensis TaxID=103725 RepID=A0A7W9KSG7_9PSEU|nr:GNAT family N-acetyltransferase [Kutzneria kofuensis]MBB5897807.1 ribosomal protein S18 acetylase RimI-like enzyme/ketosteroid isomerase-like protein [Kutzneria kofuensis]